MHVDLAITLESVVTVLGFAGAVIYQSAVIRSGLTYMNGRIVKIETGLEKITDILIKLENQTVRLDSITKRIDRLEQNEINASL